jgi:single-stranded-DNA-specific exonuclease
MQKRWNILRADNNKVITLKNDLKISELACSMLVLRGVGSYEEAKDFFRPRLSHLHDPWLMKDMGKAINRIEQAFLQKEKILVLGDYDVDGTTAVALVYQFLTSVYDPYLLDFYIPHRYHEGYGISKKSIDFAKEHHFKLIIALDCGVKSIDLIAYAKISGIDFIVCDHHMPEDELPDAIAILNPKQKDCLYPYKELCGCGIGFKLISALAERFNTDKALIYNYLDLVATAIAADIVPITGENRILAYFGLKKINENPCEGIKALIQLGGIHKIFHLTNVVFIIAPRINAAGRMDDARKAVQLFIEKDVAKATSYAQMLHSDNSDRKEADLSITEEALQIIACDETLLQRKSTVVFRAHWHKGVVGIVASRLIEKYYRPTIVLTQSGELVAGSARSVHGFNLYEAIHACREHLLAYGGHFAAAGMTLLPGQVEAFSSKFEEVVAASIHPEHLIPQITIDAEVRFKDLTPSLYNIISQMEPFGPGNVRPVFVARHLSDYGWSKIVKDHHIRFSLQQDNIVFTGIGFNMADKFALLQLKKMVDVVFTLDENDWNNQRHLQLKVIDLQLSEC